ncbi:hypothetical protein SARC_18166, partial [Sphaeroforma arctica JP610]
ATRVSHIPTQRFNRHAQAQIAGIEVTERFTAQSSLRVRTQKYQYNTQQVSMH